ncbi:hypothetical protein PUR49_01065 [Streptomyces sp. BE147]|uniref:hypothetical protein n=1 Tax=Streptomyces sp. BE147 TaxID=3002524 RepID=UPI002E76CC8A|nr:hypothetical protein [Streptomyces sp. BE147]MEE1735142.1 hypothetical protein [Streptomyces sp. BE147]
MSDWMPGPETAPASTPGEPPAAPAPAAPAAEPPCEPGGPAPIGVGRTPTGSADVDAQLERLADADHLPADGHIDVYEDVHRGLRDALTSLDTRPAPAPGPAPMPSYDNRS